MNFSHIENGKQGLQLLKPKEYPYLSPSEVQQTQQNYYNFLTNGFDEKAFHAELDQYFPHADPLTTTWCRAMNETIQIYENGAKMRNLIIPGNTHIGMVHGAYGLFYLWQTQFGMRGQPIPRVPVPMDEVQHIKGRFSYLKPRISHFLSKNFSLNMIVPYVLQRVNDQLKWENPHLHAESFEQELAEYELGIDIVKQIWDRSAYN